MLSGRNLARPTGLRLVAAETGRISRVLGEPMDPNELARRVERALLDDASTHEYAQGIGVVVEDDTVRLLGEVPHTVIKELIGAIAEGVPGVRRVSNEIVVWPRNDYG